MDSLMSNVLFLREMMNFSRASKLCQELQLKIGRGETRLLFRQIANFCRVARARLLFSQTYTFIQIN